MELVELKQQFPLPEIAKRIGIEITGETDLNVYAHCPFHNDPTPSFVINKIRQIARCYACSHLGAMDHVKLLQEFFHLNKEQAEEKLYMMVGVERPINSLHDVLSRVMGRLAENIGMDYPKTFFAQKGISDHVLRDMMVGYSPSFSHFKEMTNDISPDDAAKLELFRVELFDHAIIYPQFDMLGRVSGFRSRPHQGIAKYIANKSDYPIKAAQFYGLHSVRGYQIILVEGPNDVLALRSVGITNVVGMMGLLRGGNIDRYLEGIGFTDIVMLVDGDEAGMTAMMQAPNSMRVNQMPNGMDPDEIVAKYGDGPMRILINEASYPFVRKLKYRATKVPDNLTGKIMLIKSVGRELSDGLPALVLDKVQEEIAKILDIPVDHVSSAFDMIDLDTSRYEMAAVWHMYNGTEIGKELGFRLHAGMFAHPYYRRQFEQLRGKLSPTESIHEAKDLTDADIKQFTEMSHRRKLRHVLRTTSGDLANLSRPFEDSMNKLIGKVSDVTSGDIEVISAQEQFDLGVQNALDKSKNPGKLMGVSFGKGFRNLDGLLSGIRPNCMYILAANQGVGKSNTALEWALDLACYQQIPILWISLEMSAVEMSIRSLAKLTKISAKRIQVGDLRPNEAAVVMQASMTYGSSPFYLAPCGGIDIHQVISLVRKYKVTKNVQVVFLDYIQLIRGEDGNGMYERVGAISRAIKNNIAMDRSIGIPVIAVAQLSKVAVKLSAPTGEQIAESYKIAQDADAIMTIRRRSESEIVRARGEGKIYGNLQLFVDKNRAGTSKEFVELMWNDDHLTVEEV